MIARRSASGLFPTLGPVTTAALFHGLVPTDVPRNASAWSAECSVLTGSRLAGLALAAADAAAVELVPAVNAALRRAQRLDVGLTLAAEAALPEIVAALRSAGVPAVISKGPGIAAHYPIPALRPFRDVDLLVAPGTFERAMLVARRLGYRAVVEPRPWFPRRCREGVNLVRPDGASIDLHHHVPPWAWGARIPFARMLASAVEAEIGGTATRLAHPVHNLLVAALHVLTDKGGPGRQLMVWRDVAQLAAVVDPDDAVREARRVRLDWYVGMILRELPEPVQPSRLLTRLGGASASTAEAFRLRRLLPPALASRHQISQAIRIPVPNAAAFLAGYTIPSREFLLDRYGAPRAYGRWWADSGARLLGATAHQ